MCVSKGETFLCVRECVRDGPHQQLEQGCSLRGSYAQVPATGETGIQGQLLSRWSV